MRDGGVFFLVLPHFLRNIRLETTANRQDSALPAKSRPSIRKIISSIALVLASLVISLVIIEWTVRLLLPVYDPSGNIVFHQNADGVLLGIPNFAGRQWKNTGDYDVPVKINRYGFRGHKDLRQSTPNDIFVVGDSFGFGQGVPEEKRFSNVLQQMINIPVFNIAIPGDLKDYELLVNYAR